MSDGRAMPSHRSIGGVTVEGDPVDIAGGVDDHVLTPVVTQLHAVFGCSGVAAFYSALVTRIVVRVAIVYGGDFAHSLVDAARNQIADAVQVSSKQLEH